MIFIWLFTLILASAGIDWAVKLATWFGRHWFLTILLIIIFA